MHKVNDHGKVYHEEVSQKKKETCFLAVRLAHMKPFKFACLHDAAQFGLWFNGISTFLEFELLKSKERVKIYKNRN